tara:strand:- start:1230 stop:1376 length:147 start_codon:yes stop_codon:yes gene_type:complete
MVYRLAVRLGRVKMEEDFIAKMKKWNNKSRRLGRYKNHKEARKQVRNS